MLGGGRLSPVFGRGGGAVEIGSLVSSESEFYDSGNYTVLGSPDVTFNSNSIDFDAAGFYPNFENGIVFNPIVSDRSIIKWQCDLVVNAPSYGFCIGFKNYSDNSVTRQWNALFGFNATFGVNSISLRLGTTTFASGTYPTVINNGDILRINIEIAESLVRCSMQNITTSGAIETVSLNFVYTYPYADERMQNTYKIALNTTGGDFTVSNISFSTTQMTRGILFIGNSKTASFFPDTFGNGFVGRLKAANPTKNIYYDASANETINEYLARVDDLKKYLPSKVFLVDSSNELRLGTTNVDTKITSLKNQLESVGATVYYVNTMPENVLDARIINAIVEPIFVSNVLDAYSLMVDPGNIPSPIPSYISVDGVHPSATFQDELEGLIQPFI